MKYASVIAFNETKQQWRTIGVIANNTFGIVLVKINQRDPLVASTPSFRAIEEVYNKEFEDGEVTFYERAPEESSSHVERIKTEDPEFISKYREQLEKRRGYVRIGEIRTMESENISEHIEALLKEVLEDNANRPPVSARG